MTVFDNVAARAALFHMRHMEANWDSYGASPIDPRNIDKALDMLNHLQGIWSAVPCNDGTVQLEQHVCGFDVEIHIRAVVNSPGQRT